VHYGARVSEATLRARGQWLHQPGGDVVRHLLAVQAQDARAVRLALIERGGDFRDGLVITWLMRGTLHLVDSEDLPWLHALMAPRQTAGNVRRLRQLGVSEAQAERAVETIVRAVSEDGPLDRAALAERVQLGGQAVVHVLHRAAIEGRIALDVERRFFRLDLPSVRDRDAALDELARRYGACHPGATADDLAYWSGLPLRDCRPPVAPAIEDGPVPMRLLPAFDELLLGWRDRSPTVPPQYARHVHPGGGILRAVVLEDGVAVGTWTRRRGEITVSRFE
jgi:hypothetical protein